MYCVIKCMCSLFLSSTLLALLGFYQWINYFVLYAIEQLELHFSIGLQRYADPIFKKKITIPTAASQRSLNDLLTWEPFFKMFGFWFFLIGMKDTRLTYKYGVAKEPYCFLSCSFLKWVGMCLSEIDCYLWSLEISTYKMWIAVCSFPALCASGPPEDIMVCKWRGESLSPLTSCLWTDLRPHSCFILLILLPYRHIWFLSFALYFSFSPETERQHNLLKNLIHVESSCFALQK